MVLINGSAITMNNWIDQVPALLEAWYSGEQGGQAIAEALFGDANPGGKLPVTFPRTTGQLPLYYNYKPSGRIESYVDQSGHAAFPFGHGLSYTTFEYSNLRSLPAEVSKDQSVTVILDLTNTGSRDGDEVVQLYVHDVLASVVRPVKELKAFQRVSLKAGETRTISFLLDVEKLSLLDAQMNTVVEHGHNRSHAWQLLRGHPPARFVRNHLVGHCRGARLAPNRRFVSHLRKVFLLAPKMKATHRKILFLLVLFLVSCQQIPSQAEPLPSTIQVFFAAPEIDISGVGTALEIAQENGFIQLTSDPAQADVIVIQNAVPDVQALTDRLADGAGLVLFLGPGLTQADVQSLLAIPVSLQKLSDPVSLTALEGLADALTTEILWNSAPQVRQRFDVLTPVSSVQPLVVSYSDGGWILWHDQTGRKFIFDAFLDGETNTQIQEWAYFNYLVYSLVVRASGAEPLSFADYPGSPLPHAAERQALLVLMALILATAVGAFLLVRRYSLAHPEALNQIVADQARFQTR